MCGGVCTSVSISILSLLVNAPDGGGSLGSLWSEVACMTLSVGVSVLPCLSLCVGRCVCECLSLSLYGSVRVSLRPTASPLGPGTVTVVDC